MFQLEDELGHFYLHKGIGFCHSLLEDYLAKHVIVAADKYSSGAVMTVELRGDRNEVHHNMESIHKTGTPVYRRLGNNDTTNRAHWCKEAEEWQNQMRLIFSRFMDTLPPHVHKFLLKYFDTFGTHALANFYLLAKTHKGMFLRAHN